MTEKKTSLREASRLLSEALAYPDWLAAIGIVTVPQERITVYTTKRRYPKLPWMKDGWMGYPVEVKYTGRIRLL